MEVVVDTGSTYIGNNAWLTECLACYDHRINSSAVGKEGSTRTTVHQPHVFLESHDPVTSSCIQLPPDARSFHGPPGGTRHSSSPAFTLTMIGRNRNPVLEEHRRGPLHTAYQNTALQRAIKFDLPTPGYLQRVAVRRCIKMLEVLLQRSSPSCFGILG